MAMIHWILAENLLKGIQKYEDPKKVISVMRGGHHYRLSREVLSMVEQHFTKKLWK